MNPPREGQESLPPRTFLGLRAFDLLILLVPCLTPVLNLLARNPVGVPHVERLFAIAALEWVVIVGLTGLAVRMRAPRRPTVLAAFVLTYVITTGDSFIDGSGYAFGLALVSLLIVVIWVIAYRLRGTAIADILTYAMIVALLSGPVIEATRTLPALGSSARVEPGHLAVELGERPDIWLVVLDGHPGVRAIAQDFEPGAANSLTARLHSAGYQTPESAWTSYWTTDFSVPSLLDMAHPTNAVTRNKATIQDLYDVIAGDNRLVGALDSNGYATYMVESGWSGSACGSSFDHCVASPWLDESMFLLLNPSVFNDVILETLGYAFTTGATATMDWVLDNAGRLSNDDEPSFVFAHVMAPHPPFLLDADCELMFRDARSGVTFQQPGVDEGTRQEYLEGQMACVESFVTELAERVGDESIVVVVSDHGTDRRDQLVRSADTWEPAAIVERMNVLLAVSGLTDCPFEEHVLIPNVMPHVLSCLGDHQIETAPPQVHLSPDTALSEAELGDLRDLGAIADRSG